MISIVSNYTLNNFIVFTEMAFRPLFLEYPLPDRHRPVRLDRICWWFDEQEVILDFFCRNYYRHERLTVFPRTLMWNHLYDFLLDWVEARFPGSEDDDYYQDIGHLVVYMQDFRLEEEDLLEPNVRRHD